jgi:mannose-1-phosphate guanylyltransferase
MGDHPLSRKLQIYFMCFEKASRLKDNIDGIVESGIKHHNPNTLYKYINFNLFHLHIYLFQTKDVQLR